MVFFFYFHYGLKSSLSAEGILSVLSDKISRTFRRSLATEAVVRDGFGQGLALWFSS